MDQWYVLKTRVRQEQRAIDNLQNQGFELYCPLMKKKNHNRLEALFPGYVFLMNERYGRDRLPWEKVRSTRGVQGFIKFGGNLAVVKQELIDALKTREKLMGEMPVFQTGQKVVFKSGPFAELEGIYLCDKGEQRCMVLLNILSRDQPVIAEQNSLCI